jgi:hypothetical protein
MANEIEKIQKMFDDLKRDMYGLNLNSIVVVVEKTNNEWREVGSYMLELNIIGREAAPVISAIDHPQTLNFVELKGKSVYCSDHWCGVSIRVRGTEIQIDVVIANPTDSHLWKIIVKFWPQCC